MLLQIPRDLFDNPKPPQLLLCNTNKEIIGELPAYEVNLNGKWNAYSELSFSIDRMYTDMLTGESKISPLFDLAEGLRKVYVRGIGYFVIQDPSAVYADKDYKTLTCFSTEYETGQKYLENFYINTGEETSVEVIYYSSKFGNEYFSTDNLYKLASVYDAYTQYYIKDYNDNDSYVYSQVSIRDAGEFNTYDGSTVAKTLYEKSFPNVRFYWPSKPELSLLHLIFAKIPEWSIGSVDRNLWFQERRFSQDRIAVYDFLMNDVSDTFKCVIEWDTINNKVNFYEEADDGITGENDVQTRFDTDVFISRDNLTNEINIQYSTDDIKTKLKVTGGDGLDIREVNLGQDYIFNLDYYHTIDWMGLDLYTKYGEYLDLVRETTPKYTEAMKKWIGAYNLWSDLMYEVPADRDVLLIGDPFTKLYCTYVPIDNDVLTAVDSLKKWLDIYHVGDDTKATNKDNVLLMLKDDQDNSSTIRVYFDDVVKEYKVRRIVKNATTNVSSVREYTLTQWVMGELTDSFMSLTGYKITAIGTLGAYLCLTRDETIPANLEDYGIKMLEEKQKTYMTIFQLQTEQLLANEDYQCIASDTEPVGENPDGTRWLDTNSKPVKLYVRNSQSTNGAYLGWDEYDIEDDRAYYEDYVRYIDNYNKLKAVQELLVEKQRIATLYLDGTPIEGIYIAPDQITEANFRRAAAQYYGMTPMKVSWDANMPLYTFTLTGDDVNTYAVYLKGKIPWTAYGNSQGTNQAIMNYLKSITDMEHYFTEGEWMRLSPFIREDEFNDANCALTGYESEEERISICEELRKNSDKELSTLCQPSLEFSMTMGNILALKEFEPIKHQFKLGNFIRVGVRPDYVKRARLLEVSFLFDDLSDFSCTFGNLITTRSEVDKHAELLQQAITAGRAVASSASNWQKGANKANSIDQAIQDGLKNAVLEVGAASGQSIIWGENGIWGRKKVDGQDDLYEDEQFRIINNKIIFTDDNWNTSKAVFGKFRYNNQDHFGVISDAVVGGYISGSEIYGGTLDIGGENGHFKVAQDGTVTITAGDGTNAYVSTSDYNDTINAIESSRQFHIELSYSGSTIFTSPNSSTTIICKVFRWDTEITDLLPNGTTFKWKRNSNEDDSAWNSSHAYVKSSTNTDTFNKITINNSDISGNAQFSCEVHFDETQIPE